MSGRTELVDAVLVGAMKAGSTSLASRLAQHPSVVMSSIKEPRYFSLEERASKGVGWYNSLFEGEQAGQLRMEASTCYTRWPHFGDVMGRIADAAPSVKLVYILRHPVDRAYSHYGHEMRREVTMTFDEALERLPEIHAASDYRTQIERIHERFPPERLHIVLLDDFKRDERGVLRGICAHLGIDAEQEIATERVENEAGGVVSRSEAVRMTRKLGSSFPGRVAKAVFPGQLRDRVRERMVRAAGRSKAVARARQEHLAQLSPMSPETRASLLERYGPSTSWVEQYLSRSLPEWHR